MAQANYAIRVSNLDDVAAVTELLRESYPALMKTAYDAKELGPALDMMTHANPKLLSSGTYYVAESELGTVIGCGGWTRERPGGAIEEKSVGHIRHFGTHPEWTRLGIGSALFRQCERDAASAGVRELECYSALNAVAFYRALGFAKVAMFSMAMSSTVSLAGCHMRYSMGRRRA